MVDEYRYWMQLPGPEKMTDEICAALAGSGTAWISGGLSWAGALRDTVKDKLSMIDSGIRVEFVNAEELPEDLCADELIFRYDSGAEGEYLPAMDLVAFIRDRQILPRTILWIYDLREEHGQKWLEFGRALARKGAGLKLVCEGSAVTAAAKNISLFRQDDWLSEFDYLLYAMMLIQEEKWNSDLKIYACRLAIGLAGRDAERIALLLRRRGELLADPRKTAAGTVPELTEEQAERAVHTAQLMSLLPKVELLRSRFVSETSGRLSAVVPFRDDYGNDIGQPEDMELRHMVYFENIGRVVFDPKEHARLHLLYRIRNGLSHRNLVEGSDAVACLEQ